MPADAIRALRREAQTRGTACQSVILTALQGLDRVAWAERQLEEAAISLGQREIVGELLRETEEVGAALLEVLDRPGLDMRKIAQRPSTAGHERSWWFALTDALQTLESGIDAIRSLVAGQPRGGTVRAIGAALIRHLHRHHSKLLTEASTWMGS
jgi:hypothetical protein